MNGAELPWVSEWAGGDSTERLHAVVCLICVCVCLCVCV